jgi:archaemetzincin
VKPTTCDLEGISIVPVGPVKEESLSILKEKLPEKFQGTSCGVGNVTINLGESLNPHSGQYHATKILAALEKLNGSFKGNKLLGVTDLDLYVPNMNFVFGEARLPGSVAIISTHRLKETTTYGDERLFPERLIKEAIHELGHTLGLGHCENPSCVMHFSNSLADTDRKGQDYCEFCLGRLEDSE